ncbi:transposase [Lachnospiraceae bacterium NLAE-zl-G231]|nr:transposase [Lachnospiraceae bacterium NLAE-zl-G231]
MVLACGFVDLRKGIDGLAQIIGSQYDQNPFEKRTLFLFCGRHSYCMKGLLWMGSGFLLLYKRFEGGSLAWPRTTQETADITQEQFRVLMRKHQTIEIYKKQAVILGAIKNIGIL